MIRIKTQEKENEMAMTIGELKEVISDLPDSTPVLVSNGHCSYQNAYGIITKALYSKQTGWTEDCGEENTPERLWGKRTKVLIFT